MQRLIFTAIVLLAAFSAWSQSFDDYFTANTLRLDVKVDDADHKREVVVDSISQWPGWYGRRVNLSKNYFPASILVKVIDTVTRDTIYVDTKESNAMAEMRPGGSVYVQIFVPKPKSDCEIIASVADFGPEGFKSQKVSVTLTADQLNGMSASAQSPTPFKTIRRANDPDRCINLAILAEGYTAAEADKFYRKAQMLDSVMFTVQPGFRDNADRFNVVAVMLSSPQSGLSIPSQGITVNSALGAHFDSFGLERLVTLPDTRPVWDALCGIPAAHILILGNTDKYGGSGSLNEYAIASADIDNFEEVLIHEFGHSFIMLGDEYEAGGYDDAYPSNMEPLEPNITTLYDFSGKWADLILRGEASLIEGAGYQLKGVWRGCEKCLMRAIPDRTFCPVCSQCISRVIDFYTVPAD